MPRPIAAPALLLWASALLPLCCGLLRVNRYEHNHLLVSGRHSRLILSAESLSAAQIRPDAPLRYWSEGREWSHTVTGLRPIRGSWEVTLFTGSDHGSRITPISYSVGPVPLWFELLR